MKRFLAAASFIALAACQPAPTGPEAAVTAIYKPLADSKGQEGTDMVAFPMTEALALLIQEVESAADGPVFDLDIAGICQDCTGFGNLKISTPTDAALAPSAGHHFVEATFDFAGKEKQAVFWDLVEVDGAWKVDNVFTEGYDVRLIANEQIEARAKDLAAGGEAAVQCMAYVRLRADAVSKATPAGDTAALDAAYAYFKAVADGSYTANELAQFLASSVAVLDDTPPAQLETKASECLVKVPAPAMPAPVAPALPDGAVQAVPPAAPH